MPALKPTIYLIAGCNGAGKTTFAKEFLPYEVKCLRFYNADEIVRGLSPLDPSAGAIKAGRLLLGEVRDSINRHETFALKHAQRQDVYSYLRARAFIRATIWNSTIFGFRTWSRRSRVCADALLWEDTMFQRRTFVGDSNAASVVCSMITCPSRRAGQFGTTADCQPNN